MRILNIAGLWILAVTFTSCLRVPTQTLEFPVGFKGCAIIAWSQPGYPPLQSNKDNLLLRFPADGILITSTPAPTVGAFKERVFYIDSSGVRIHTNAPPRVERLDGVES
jgi:hypothetical protein